MRFIKHAENLQKKGRERERERKKQREGREKRDRKKKKGSTTRHQADSEQA